MIRVTCAIIEREGKILLAQRSESMALPLKWEFPGGKLEAGEDAVTCIRREIREELGLEIDVAAQLQSFTTKGIDKTIELIPFVCKIISGEIKLAEHSSAVWVSPQEAHNYDLAEADVPVLKHYLSLLR